MAVQFSISGGAGQKSCGTTGRKGDVGMEMFIVSSGAVQVREGGIKAYLLGASPHESDEPINANVGKKVFITPENLKSIRKNSPNKIVIDV